MHIWSNIQTKFSNKVDDVWSGVVKGSEASVPLWIAIEQVILETLKQLMPPQHIPSPCNTTYSYNMSDFIYDNISAITVLPIHNNYHNMKVTPQKHSQVWNYLLTITGGILSYSKCKNYIFQWPLVNP